jgi:Transposase
VLAQPDTDPDRRPPSGFFPTWHDAIPLGIPGRWSSSTYFDARQTSAAVEGINNKARVVTKRAYGLKSAQSLWDRLILDLNWASQAIGSSINYIRQIAKGLKVLFDWSCT